MSQDILFEVNFFLHSFLLGAVITFVYDWFLILRRSIRHNLLAISVEDMIFWIACALGVFYMLYRENNGILRWFAVLGAAIGMLAYKRLISTFFVNFISSCILKVFSVICKVIFLVLKPIIYAGKKVIAFLGFIKRKVHILAKFVKKKLTVQLKLIKMILCKQKKKKESGNGKKSGVPQKTSE